MTADELNAWMDRRDVTVAALATHLEVSERTVYYWRSGKVPISRVAALAMRYTV